jgi:hypothetical protein
MISIQFRKRKKREGDSPDSSSDSSVEIIETTRPTLRESLKSSLSRTITHLNYPLLPEKSSSEVGIVIDSPEVKKQFFF